ncbi:MAG: thioesterase domain-containing protein [Planctomycetota bacterium]|jgi:thioesterase domain-containing protein
MENVEDLFPLAPMQRAMLLRALSTGGQESLFQQFVFELEGGLDTQAFRAAWSRSVSCHSSLRSAFLWRGLKQPLQVVRREAAIPYRDIDGGALVSASGPSRAEVLGDLLAKDRDERFDLGVAPLTRVLLVRWSDAEWTFVWTSHHLVLDRWSTAPLLDDVWRFYEAEVAGEASGVPRRGRYRDYVAWIENQDAAACDSYWATRLAGATHATRTMTTTATGNNVAFARFRMDRASNSRLRSAAQAARVTPGVVLQAAWALTMAELAECHDVCFGLTVSGRPPAVPGIEHMVGSFIGNVPVRVILTSGLTALEICQALLRDGQSRGPFEYLAPTDFHRIAELPPGEPLFDSLLVWLSSAEASEPAGISVRAVPGEAATAWPLTISVLEEDGALVVSARTAGGTSLRGGLAVVEVVSHLERMLDLLVRLLRDAPGARLADHVRIGEPGGTIAPLSWSPEDPSVAPLTVAQHSAGAPGGADVTEFESGGREFDDPETMKELLYDECQALLPSDAPLDPAQGFFEQGGSSMLAAQLHARLEALTGRALPLLELFEAPTIEAMGQELTSKPWPLHGGVLRAARREGSRPPLFCVSSPEVNSLGYVTLSRHLSADQPVYLTQGRPSGGDAVFRMAVSDIPKLASDSVDAILKQFPSGPYRLFGMCDGALIAFEMARLLEEKGADVDFVCLLNTYALGTLSRRYKVKRAVTRVGYYRRRLQEVLGANLGVGASATASHAEEKPSNSAAVPTRSAEGAGEPATTLAERLASINGEWFELDTPRHLPAKPPLSGRITVLRNTAQPYWRIRDKALGWRAYSGNVDVLDLQAQREAVEGPERRVQQDAHMALLREPDILYVARALNERLEALERDQA